jgi:hypothetical protein
METWAVVFLGIIAASAAVQAGFIVGLVAVGRRVGKRLDALEEKLDKELGPAIQNLDRVTRNVAEISDLATLQARRIDLLLVDTIEKVEDATTTVQRLVARPLRPVGHAMALLRAVRKGIEVFTRLREPEAGTTSHRRRHHEDDEHLFI